MKIAKPLLFLFILCFIKMEVVFSQADKTKKLKDLPESFMTTGKLPNLKKNEENLFDKRMMNAFFTNRVSNYMSTSSDINFAKGYALLDNSDGRLFIGGTWNPRENKAAKTRYLVTAGVKSNVKDQFASLYEGGKMQNDIGLSFKFTVIGNGCIGIGSESKKNFEKIRVRRELMLAGFERKIQNDIDDFEKTLDKAYPQRNTPKADAETIHKISYDEQLDEYVKKQYKKYEEEIANAEAESVYDNNLFTYAWDHWLGIEVYYPITSSKYNIADSLRVFKPREEEYKPIAASLTYTNVFEMPHLGKFMLMLGTGIQQNNSVKAEDIKKYSYDQYLVQSIKDTLPGTSFPDTLLMASLKKDDVYVGKYENWFGPQLRGKFVWMPFDFIGVSISGELNYRNGNSNYFNENKNWTIGIPVSLNDKDGERLVNFELQWREVAQEHSVGISVNYIFGKPEF